MLDEIHQNIEKQAKEIDISCDEMLTIESHSRNIGKKLTVNNLISIEVKAYVYQPIFTIF